MREKISETSREYDREYTTRTGTIISRRLGYSHDHGEVTRFVGGCHRPVHMVINGFSVGGSEEAVHGSTGVADAELDLATRS